METKTDEAPVIKRKPKFSLIILVVILVIISIGGIYLIFRSFASTPTQIGNASEEEIIPEEELIDEENQNTPVASSLGSLSANTLIANFNNQTITAPSQPTNTVAGAKATTATPVSDYEKQLETIKEGKGNYLYYFSSKVDPYIYMYEALKNKNTKTLNVNIYDPVTRKNVVKTIPREEYIGMAVNLSNAVLGGHLEDINGDNKKEVLCLKNSEGVYNCGNEKIKNKSVRIQYALYIERAARSMARLALLIKQDPALKSYVGSANKYVDFVNNDVIRNPYYEAEYNPNKTGSHHKSPFVNAHAIETLLNMGRIKNNDTYIKAAVKMASRHRDASEKISKGKDYILVSSSSNCDAQKASNQCYTIFQEQTRAICDNCQAADTSHMNSYIKMVLTFYEYENSINKKNKTFDLSYVKKLANTMEKKMWQPAWVPANKGAVLKGTVIVKKAAQAVINNPLYDSALNWPKNNALVGKKVILSCPTKISATGATKQTKYLATIKSNNKTTITLAYSQNKPSITAAQGTLNCNYEVSDYVQYRDGEPFGYLVNGQYSDFSNGHMLTVYVSKTHGLKKNPNYAPGSMGRNFAEWVGLAKYSASLKNQLKNEVSLGKVSGGSKPFISAMVLGW